MSKLPQYKTKPLSYSEWGKGATKKPCHFFLCNFYKHRD